MFIDGFPNLRANSRLGFFLGRLLASTRSRRNREYVHIFARHLLSARFEYECAATPAIYCMQSSARFGDERLDPRRSNFWFLVLSTSWQITTLYTARASRPSSGSLPSCFDPFHSNTTPISTGRYIP